MAHACNAGLNAVSELGSPLTNAHPLTSGFTKAWDIVTGRQPSAVVSMESSGKTSRLPRFGFGLRKSNRKNNGENSNGNKSSNSSPGSSPGGVNRSKSMRVNRVQPPPKLTKQSNSLEDDDDSSQQRETIPTASRLRPPHGIRTSRSQPNSRSASPHVETSSSYMSDSLSSQDSTGSARANKTSPLLSQMEGHARSNSFHTREVNTAAGKPTHASGPGSGLGNMNGLPRSRAMTVGSRIRPKNDHHIPKVTVPKMGSFDQADGGMVSKPDVSHVTTKKGESLANQMRRGSYGSQGGLNKRPSSLIYLEDTHDLNQLASELSRLDGEEDRKNNSERHTYHSRLPGITRQRSPAYARHDHASRVGPSPSLTSPLSGKHGSKLRPPVSRTGSGGDKRPSSAASHYRVNESQYPSRPKSAADTHKINHSLGHRRQNSQTYQGSQSPSPTSSGRSTPMSYSRRLSELEKLEEEGMRPAGQNQSKDDEVTPRRPPAAQARTGPRTARAPFFRGSYTDRRRSKEEILEEAAMGLNELEGTVLVDAEDYRLMVKEVKHLKTVLLRLKRELTTTDASNSPGVGGAGGHITPAVGMTASRLRRNAGPQNTELLNKIKELTAERDKLQVDAEENKKKEKLDKKKVEDLQKKLKESDVEKSELSNNLVQLRSDRERLLEKVERLHADNHKLEHQLTSLEQSALYECTILDDGEGEGWMDGEEGEFTYEDEDATF